VVSQSPPWLRLVQSVTRLPLAYKLSQYVAYPTTSRFRVLLERHVSVAPDQRVLDLACGIGNYRESIGGDYHGADINRDYIELAAKRHSGHFDVMDCCNLTYDSGYFHHVLTIAATHHLSDGELDAMVQEAKRVCRADGLVHVLDAVLPAPGHAAFKRAWFSMDAGRFPRTRQALRRQLGKHGTVTLEDLIPGPLHDCAYFQLRP
jgi:ubiquinone/menaquinone biosynthesis C-methylase UbiE